MKKFSPHPQAELQAYLRDQLALNDPQAKWLADFSNGRLGLAIDLKNTNAFSALKRELEQFAGLLRGSWSTRLAYTEQLFAPPADKVDWSRLSLLWLLYLRSPLARTLKVDRIKLSHQLLALRPFLMGSQYNQRLILENLLISI